jgi:anti-anti-sigma factor
MTDVHRPIALHVDAAELGDCRVSARRRGTTLVVSVGGELDLHGLAAFDGLVRGFADPDTDAGIDADRVDGLLLDLREVTFLDSSGLRAVLSARLRAMDAGKAFAIGPASSTVQRVIALAGLDELLPTG